MRWAAVCLLALAACTPIDQAIPSFAGPNSANATIPVPPSEPIIWRVDPACVTSEEHPVSVRIPWHEARDAVRRGCLQDDQQDFVAIGISGGGTKAAIFGAESMFFLDAIGVLKRTSLISSVSGGSFAASYYSLSCEPGATLCLQKLHDGLKRPEWDYARTMNTMASGFKPMLFRALKNFLIPLVGTPVRVSSFAHYIDRTYLGGEGSGDAQFRFSDLNPRRPTLALNSTLLSGTRPLAEGTRKLQYLRRRNADEMLHFAFTDYYFNHIGSELGPLPLSFGVASSSAFPALIGYAELRNFRYCTTTENKAAYDECLERDDTKLTLTDGGANDNQGLVELLAAMGELVLHERRSDLVDHRCADPHDLGCDQFFRRGDRALLFVLNSSITESTGTDGRSEFGFRPLGFLLGTVDRVSAAVDAYSAVGYNLRKRLYMADRDEVNKLLEPDDIKIMPVEIGLTTLDRYADQGADVARRREAGVLSTLPCSAPKRGDPEYVGREIDCGTRPQKDAWRYLQQKHVRDALALGRVHPQCLFEQSKPMESGLTSLAKIDDVHIPCLRDAARWATALRAEELCELQAKRGVPMPFHDGTIACSNGHLEPLTNHWRTLFDAKHCDMTVQVRNNTDSENKTIVSALAEADAFARERSEFHDAAAPDGTLGIAIRRLKAQSGGLDLARLCDMDDVKDGQRTYLGPP